MRNNTMKRNEKQILLDEWSAHWESIRVEYTKLREIFDLSPECRMSTVMHELFDSHTKAVGLLLGDGEDWMSWFAWENDNGLGRMKAKAANWEAEREIRSTVDLLDLIENSKAES